MPITVVVPIHDAVEETARCLDSLERHGAPARRILLLDDASGDPRMAPLLAAWSRDHPRFETLPNPVRQGYTATVNRGCRLAAPDDVVLLNSDVQVTPRWLEKMAEAARRVDRVATVTPVSNAAGAFSVPRNFADNPLPQGVSLEEMSRLVEALSPRLYPRVPTGNGFCLLVRRPALDEVGPFDAERFPDGYGSENDFCLRALRRGFVHLIDDATFVFHRRGASHGAARRRLTRRALRRLDRLYPDYRARVAEWLADDPVDRLRERLAAALAAGADQGAGASPSGRRIVRS